MRASLRTACLAALLLAPAAWGQAGTSRPAEPAVGKIGILNVQVAITSTAEGKQASAELQSQFAPRQTELDNLRKQIEDLQNRLRAGATTLSDEAKAQLAREGDQLTRRFQRDQQDLQDDENEAQREVVNRIGQKLVDVLDRYAKENGFSIILDNSSQNTPVMFSSPQIDVTQEVIRLYDQTNPVRSSTPPATTTRPPATRPPATKPPAPGTKPPQQ